MTTVASLVRVLHDIDAVKGRVCGNCFYRRSELGGCRLGHKPYGLDDGCEDFRGRPVDAWKAWPVPRGKTHPRTSNELGGHSST